MQQFQLLRGRLGRLAFGGQLAVVLSPLAAAQTLANSPDWRLRGLLTILIILCTGVAALLAVRRLHDRGLSGWYTLALAVPVLNLFGLLLLLVLPGTPGQNRWGLAPLSPVRSRLLRFNPAKLRPAARQRSELLK